MPRHNDVLQQIRACKLVPAVRTRTASCCLRALTALHNGGLRVFEVPLTVSGALDVLQQARRALPADVLLGSGTVLDEQSARAAILAGADFLVSPSFTPGMLRVAQRYGVPAFSGALTPTEVLASWEAGSDCVKVFPASAMGGPAYIRALHAPLPNIPLMPMGGVTSSTVRDYLDAGAAMLGIGADLVSQADLDQGFDGRLSERAELLVSLIAG